MICARCGATVSLVFLSVARVSCLSVSSNVSLRGARVSSSNIVFAIDNSIKMMSNVCIIALF